MELPENEQVMNITNISMESNLTISSYLSQGKGLFDSHEFQALLIFLYTLVFLTCFLGNLTVLLVFTLNSRMRTGCPNVIQANLAAADLSVAIFCVYQNLSIYLIKNWVLGNILCKMYSFVDRLAYTGSITLLVFISLERYLAIVHHQTWKKIITKKTIPVVISLLWIFAILLNCPRLYYVHSLSHAYLDNGILSYEVFCIADLRIFNTRYYDLSIFLALYLLPLVFILGTYLRIGIFFGRAAYFLKRGSSSPNSCPKSNSITTAESMRTTREPRELSILPDEPIIAIFQNNSGNPKSRNIDYEVVLAVDVRSETEEAFEVNMPQNRVSESEKGQKRVFTMLVLIVLAFAICNAPYHCRKVLQHFRPDLLFLDKRNLYYPLFTISTNLLTYVNSALNPILYVFWSKRFQESFKELFCGRFWDFISSKRWRRGHRKTYRPPPRQLSQSQFD